MIIVVYLLQCNGKHCFNGNSENLANSFISSRTKLIFGTNVPWQNSCCQKDPCVKYELCQTWDERVIQFFVCCHGEDIYHSNSHRNSASKKLILSQLIFVANINFFRFQMNELLRLSPLPWKQVLPQQQRKQRIAIVPKDLCATYELCSTLKKELS